MSLSKVTGSRIYIGTRVNYKSTVSTSDFSGMVWTEIDGWQNTGDLGSQQEAQTEDIINRNVRVYAKGIVSFPIMQIVLIPLPTDAGQTALKIAQKSCKPYAFKIEWDAACGAEAEVAISNATPGVVTWNGHGLANGTPVSFTTTNTLPLPLVPGVTYYVVGATTDTFSVALTPGGTAIDTTTVGTGTHTARALTPGDTRLFFGFAMFGTDSGGTATANRLMNVPIQPIAAPIPV